MDCFKSIERLDHLKDLTPGYKISNENIRCFNFRNRNGGVHIGIGSFQNFELAARSRVDLLLTVDENESVADHLYLFRTFLKSSENSREYAQYVEKMMKISLLSKPEKKRYNEFFKSFNEGDFQHMKQLVDSDRFGIIEGDIFSGNTIDYINKVIKVKSEEANKDLKITSAYFSNVEQLAIASGREMIFYDLLKKLPWSKDPVVLRTYFSLFDAVRMNFTYLKYCNKFYHQSLEGKNALFFYNEHPPYDMESLLIQMVLSAYGQQKSLPG